jgi:hypothetical protein
VGLGVFAVMVLGMRLLSGLFGGLSLFWTFWTEIEEAEERSIDAVSGVIILLYSPKARRSSMFLIYNYAMATRYRPAGRAGPAAGKVYLIAIDCFGRSI